jgi:hypothetical protein
VLPHLRKGARARSRSPNPLGRRAGNRDNKRPKDVVSTHESTSAGSISQGEKEGSHQSASQQQGEIALKGLGLEGHHPSSIDSHVQSKHQAQHLMHDRTQDLESTTAGHEESKNSRRENEDHSAQSTPARTDDHNLLTPEQSGRPSPEEIFHRRQASVKSPGGRKFAGNRPADLQLNKSVSIASDRKDSPRSNSMLTPKPNIRKTGAYKIENKEVAASHMTANYESFSKGCSFDRLEEHAAGLTREVSSAPSAVRREAISSQESQRLVAGTSQRPTQQKTGASQFQNERPSVQAGQIRNGPQVQKEEPSA